jgi:hypothetical protein
MDHLSFSACGNRAVDRFLKKRSGVSIFARAAIYRN